MQQLMKQLKPYRWFILLVVVFHLIQAYTTLMLPDYTSRLIDTGIQNDGFEYAVPQELTKEGYATLSHFLLPDEAKEIDDYYTEDNGHYVLDTAVLDNKDEMEKLQTQLMEPLAIAQFMRMPKEKQPEQIPMEALQQMTPSQLREKFQPELDKLGDTVVKSMAIQFAKSEYESLGGDLGQHQIDFLFNEGLKMILVSFLAMGAALGAFYIASIVGARVGHDLRSQTFSHVLEFSQTEIDKFSTASLITRSTNDIQQIQMLITLMLRMTLYAPILAIGGIIHVIMAKSNMAWIIVLAVALVIGVVSILLALTMPKFKLMQKKVDKVNLYAREILTGLQVIRAFGRQEVEAERFDEASTELKDTYLFTNRTMSLMMPLMMLIMNGIAVLIIWVAGHRISQGTLQVGELTAFINYTMQIIFGFLMFTMVAVVLPRAMVAATRVQEVIDTPLSIQDPEQPVTLSHPKGEVAFRHVGFRFDGAEENTLAEIDFVAHTGQTTAIIGSTGSGKSTILNLLMRFYDVTQGQITIDGVDIRDMRQQDLRDMMGYVAQKGILFSGTISSNIGYGVEALDEPSMIEAATIAHAVEFIEEKPDQYESNVAQGGGNVSGGQKQRISIARAIAKKPSIYLFDDSFSALDYRTDVSLRQAIKDKTEDATVIIVAQRISTILNAEQIIVLDNGRIAGIGTHSQLMRESKVYREIATSQLSAKELEEYEGGDQHE